jgi:acyl-CoA synthetase (NDP forming)
MRSLAHLLRPKSIAAFGGREAERVVRECDRMGFSGEIWPVHPSREEMGGRRCFRTVDALPGAPDAAFVGVNRERTVEIVGALAARGAGGAICYASGFREAESGAALQQALVLAAGDMPIIGPNCYGLINYLDGVPLWPDHHGGTHVESGVAIVTQSSNIALNITMQRRGLPIAFVASAGNQAQTSVAEIAAAFLEDERVTAVGLHVEGVADVAHFEAMARRARSLGKPVVAVTAGRSEEGRRAAFSHTASITSSDAATAAFFARLAIPRLRSLPELLEALKLLHVHGVPAGRDLCSMSCSGGDAALMADAAIGRAVRFRQLDAEEKERVKATLSDLVAIENPLDYHTFIWGREDAMAETFSAMIGCGFDLSMLVLDFPRADRCGDADYEAATGAILAAARRTNRPVAVVATLPENMPEARAAAFLAAGIAPLCGIDEAIAGFDAAASIGERWRKPPPQPVLAARAADAPCRTMFEVEAKAALAPFGLTSPPRRLARDCGCVVAAAEAIGYPVAVKALGVAHKSETGAVRLDLKSDAEVKAAAEALCGLGAGLLVEAMVRDAVAELLVGVVRDGQFGLLMTIAAGGVLAELFCDAVTLLLPASEGDIREAILSLRVAKLLSGFRGRPAGDIDAAVAAAVAVARFAEANAATLEELDVNPLMVLPQGRGAVAADALIRVRVG